VTRWILTAALASLALAVGLWTAVVVSYNHQRAENLSRLQRDLEILRASNDQAAARAASHVWGQGDSGPATAPAAVELAPAEEGAP
jgi:predicted histidine transporter YuiF (NhaC family)